ncbi:MAG TPA: hypothetical protein GX010_01115 [Erysipelotrichaceae bacterium]|nr:hypothetical protein [Erysipelotrichaceae bacterium]
MKETRLEKYKNYRQSLNEIKVNSQQEEVIKARNERTITEALNTTSTLPLDEVVGKIDETQKNTGEIIVTRRSIGIIVFVIVGILLLIGILIFAFIAFGGN